uniref:Uncharacterized protein n=1 Tax=Opuntia streptacantha TaxID=393608 RepID=A0A7C9DJK6_OPUST
MDLSTPPSFMSLLDGDNSPQVGDNNPPHRIPNIHHIILHHPMNNLERITLHTHITLHTIIHLIFSRHHTQRIQIVVPIKIPDSILHLIFNHRPLNPKTLHTHITLHTTLHHLHSNNTFPVLATQHHHLPLPHPWPGWVYPGQILTRAMMRQMLRKLWVAYLFRRRSGRLKRMKY